VPAITDQPPEDPRQELTRLRRQFTRDVPREGDQNLLIATWTIREFGGLIAKSPGAEPKR
jgi:hypothetical protein